MKVTFLNCGEVTFLNCANNGALLLNWVAIGSPFPVIHGDVRNSAAVLMLTQPTLEQLKAHQKKGIVIFARQGQDWFIYTADKAKPRCDIVHQLLSNERFCLEDYLQDHPRGGLVYFSVPLGQVMKKLVKKYDCQTQDLKLRAKGNYHNYDAHYAPVVSADVTNPREMWYYPVQPKQKAVYTEVVITQESQCLPRYLVTLKKLIPGVRPSGMPGAALALSPAGAVSPVPSGALMPLGGGAGGGEAMPPQQGAQGQAQSQHQAKAVFLANMLVVSLAQKSGVSALGSQAAKDLFIAKLTRVFSQCALIAQVGTKEQLDGFMGVMVEELEDFVPLLVKSGKKDWLIDGALREWEKGLGAGAGNVSGLGV